MRKRDIALALMTLLIFVFSCPAFAAPTDSFADVPAGHWAYGALKQLNKAGIVEGYGDGSFRGEKPISRYEMAIIVANAMTKAEKANAQQKALIEKLAAEFNSELVKLGARVSAVEKKAAIFSFSNRLQFNTTSLGPNDPGGWLGTKIKERNQFLERIRIYMNSPVGDEWYFSGRLFMHKTNYQRDDSTPAFDYLNVTNSNILGGTLTLGKQLLYPGRGGLICVPGYWDAALYTAKVNNFYFRIGDGRYNKDADMPFAELSYRISPYGDIGIYTLQNRFSGIRDTKMTTLFGNFEIGNGMSISAEYGKNHADASGYSGKSAYWIALNSKAKAGNYAPGIYTISVDPRVKNDHAWGLSYRHIPAGATGYANRGASAAWVPYSQDTAGSYQNGFDNINAIRFDYHWVPWKNVWAILTYDHIKPIGGGWTNNSLQFSLNFVFP